MKKRDKNENKSTEERNYNKKYIERIVEEKEAQEEIEDFKDKLNEDSETIRRTY